MPCCAVPADASTTATKYDAPIGTQSPTPSDADPNAGTYGQEAPPPIKRRGASPSASSGEAAGCSTVRTNEPGSCPARRSLLAGGEAVTQSGARVGGAQLHSSSSCMDPMLAADDSSDGGEQRRRKLIAALSPFGIIKVRRIHTPCLIGASTVLSERGTTTDCCMAGANTPWQPPCRRCPPLRTPTSRPSASLTKIEPPLTNTQARDQRRDLLLCLNQRIMRVEARHSAAGTSG
jgi:hypothetical protein